MSTRVNIVAGVHFTPFLTFLRRRRVGNCDNLWNASQVPPSFVAHAVASMRVIDTAIAYYMTWHREKNRGAELKTCVECYFVTIYTTFCSIILRILTFSTMQRRCFVHALENCVINAHELMNAHEHVQHMLL